MAWMSKELGNKYYGEQCSPEDEWTPDEPYPAPAPITVISMRQARLQLSVLGKYQEVLAAVPTMGEMAEIEFEYAATVDRSNSLTQAIVQLLGWTEQETDDYFIAASKL